MRTVFIVVREGAVVGVYLEEEDNNDQSGKIFSEVIDCDDQSPENDERFNEGVDQYEDEYDRFIHACENRVQYLEKITNTCKPI